MKLRICVLGTRGFPNIQGGVEIHCEHLYPLLVKNGCEITVFTRVPYVGTAVKSYKNVNLVPISCPRSKSLEAIIHTSKGVFAAKRIGCDIIHIHAVGPSLCVPLVRLLGLRVVMTHHGPDYMRKKWNRFAKFAIRMGEKFGCRWANGIICVSKAIAKSVKDTFGRDSAAIPNGVMIPEPVKTREALEKFGLEKGRYILAVGRLVPEKGFHDLIDGFVRAQGTGHRAQEESWKLVIAGDADHEDDYSRELKQKAKENKNVILTGFLTGQPLQELYSHAGLFALPSYYEGLPIALLEAMSYGLSCIASDIPANKEVNLGNDRYFKPGDIDGITSKIGEYIQKPLDANERKTQIDMIKEKYNWEKIAEKTLAVYTQIMNYK